MSVCYENETNQNDQNLAHLTLRTVYSLGKARLNISDMCHLEPVTPPGNRLYLEDLNLWCRSRNCVCAYWYVHAKLY